MEIQRFYENTLQKQINSYMPTVLKITGNMNVSVSSQKTRREIEQESIREKKLGNQIGEHIVDLYELNIFKTQV